VSLKLLSTKFKIKTKSYCLLVMEFGSFSQMMMSVILWLRFTIKVLQSLQLMPLSRQLIIGGKKRKK
jgi:hypothetical protein